VSRKIDSRASRVFDSRSFFFCVCRHEIRIACSVASAPRIRGVPRMPYPGCRTQDAVPRAALRFALGYLIMPLWGWGPMVHRRDLQTGHSPVLQKERDPTHAPSVPRFHGHSSRRSQLQPIGPGCECTSGCCALLVFHSGGVFERCPFCF
jgi:hypothetical protein